MSELLAQKLNSPIEGVEARKHAEWWNDIPQVSASYWQMLSERPDDRAAWDEVESFFRTNEVWDELVKLLRKKIDRVGKAEALVLWDDILLSYRVMPEGGLSAGLAMLQSEISRTTDPELRAGLEERKRKVEADIEAAAEPEGPAVDPNRALLLGLVVVVALLAIVVIAIGAYAMMM